MFKFQNPCTSAIKESPPNLQFKMIKLQCNDTLKSNYHEKSLIQFCKFHPSNKYVQLKSCIHELMSIFGYIYLCEKIFSKMKCVLYITLPININKKIYKLILLIAKTTFELQIGKILLPIHQIKFHFYQQWICIIKSIALLHIACNIIMFNV